MIMLCSLPSSYEHLVDTLMYGRQTLTKGNVKETLNSKQVIQKEVKEPESLVARRRLEKKKRVQQVRKKRSKSKPKNLKYSQCHKGQFKKDYPERKFKNKDWKGWGCDDVVWLTLESIHSIKVKIFIFSLIVFINALITYKLA